MPKHIVFDGRMIGWTGIGRYSLKLLEQLEKLDKTNSYTVLVQKKDWEKFKPKAKNFKKAEVNIEPYGAANQTKLTSIIQELKPGLVHFPHFTVPLNYADPYVVTIHDLTLLDFNTARGGFADRFAYSAKQVVMKQVVKHAVAEAEQVICDTEFTAIDLAHRFHIDPSKITVTYLAADKLANKPGKIKVEKPFLLYVGNFYPNKNLSPLIEALPKILQTQSDLKLVIVGPQDSFRDKLKEQVEKLNLDKKVIFSGRVSDAELAGLYKEAALFVFPSLAEGFGLPPLEAMSYGTPVIASNASCLPEILGEAAIYFDPMDVDNIAEEIDALLNTPEELAQLRKAGPKQAAKYSWAKMAKTTLEIYRRIG